ncbi:MAG TPA: hypothetical protein PLS66_02945 [Tepiditoga sp.]|nr:hypothetical protein [Tepiditoga sp.]
MEKRFNKSAAVILIIIFSVTVFPYRIKIFPDDFSFKNEKINIFENYYKISDEKIRILICDTLYEFTEITGYPYSYYNGVYNSTEDIIIILPEDVLRKKNRYERVIVHECFHHYLTKYFSMNKSEQEKFIEDIYNSENPIKIIKKIEPLKK